MPQPFMPEANQPLNAFFTLTLGSFSKIYTGVDTQGYANPNTPVDFEYTVSENGDTQVTLTLFDETGYEVEPYIWMTKQQSSNGVPGGTFQFGWLGSTNALSDTYTFDIQQYSVQVLDNSFAITLVGTNAISPHISSNQINGTISQILSKFTDLHGIQIEQSHELGTQFVLESCVTARDDTALRELIFSKLTQETDMQFLNRVVKDYYRDNQGRGGFNCYIGSEGGQRVIYVVRPSDDPAQMRYTVNAKSTPVIKWNPNIVFDNVTWGSNDVFVHTIQHITGDTQTIALQQGLTKQYQNTQSNPDPKQTITSTPPAGQAPQLINGPTEVADNSVTGSCVRAMPGATCSPYVGISPWINNQLRTAREDNNAQLTVIGDPQIGPSMIGQNIEVLFYYPQNYRNSIPTGLHYTSDTYALAGFTQSIKDGKFETVLDLKRAGLTTVPTTTS